MKRYGYWPIIAAIVFVFVISGCDLLTGFFKSDDDTLSGKIRSVSYEFTYGYASTGSTYYDIYLLSADPATGQSIYPYVVFSLPIANDAQTYAINALGQSSGGRAGIMVTGYSTELYGTWFDSGTLEIESVDLENGQISGAFHDAETTEGTSSISGTFTISIQ